MLQKHQNKVLDSELVQCVILMGELSQKCVKYIELGLNPDDTGGRAFETSFLEGQASSCVMLEHDNRSDEYYSTLQND